MPALNRLYYPIKYSSRSQVVNLGIKCVFISHQRKDKDSARKVADYLQNAGIDIYFDEYDKELKVHHQNKNPKGVTEAICNGINNSSQMLVIVSPNTIYSNWVPFEIGYGYEKTQVGVLCLKGIPKGALPEYIRTVPIVRDIYDLNKFITELSGKSEDQLLETRLMSNHSSNNPLSDVMDSIIADTY